jgi:hypothetical protein
VIRCRVARGLASAGVAATISRQPRLPQRQIGPRSSTVVADLARGAATGTGARRSWAGADAGGHLQYTSVDALAPQCTSAERGLASLSTWTGTSARSLYLGDADVGPAGRMAEEPTVPVERWIGPGMPSPTPSTRSVAVPGLERLADSLTARPRRSARRSLVIVRQRSARISWERSQTATRGARRSRCRWPRRPRVEGDPGRRPPFGCGGTARRGVDHRAGLHQPARWRRWPARAGGTGSSTRPGRELARDSDTTRSALKVKTRAVHGHVLCHDRVCQGLEDEIAVTGALAFGLEERPG